jgi:hypothetical protein
MYYNSANSSKNSANVQSNKNKPEKWGKLLIFDEFVQGRRLNYC